MKVEIHHIPTQGLILEFERPARKFAALKELMDSGECEFLTPLVIRLEVLPVRDFFQVRGCIDTTIGQACGRCLESFTSPLKCRFTLNYSRDIPIDVHKTDADGIELTAEQIGMTFFKGDEIDFTDAIQEQVILAMPYKPLCRNDCRGLCAQCGHDLNTGPCQCVQQPLQGPFAVLRSLKVPVKR